MARKTAALLLADHDRLPRVWRKRLVVQAGPEGIRFLLVPGKPLEEPIAWYGPIVMNYPGELKQAIIELQEGTFIKHR